jgi:hypothetical protein
MFRPASLWFALLSATTAIAAVQNFRLGVDYSELIPTGALVDVDGMMAATDAQGAIYILVDGGCASLPCQFSYVAKVTPAGDRVVYQTPLGFPVSGMAVDPAGNVYLSGGNFVEKLGTDGVTVEYKTVLGSAPSDSSFGLITTAIAVDANGGAYVTGVVQPGSLNTTPGAFEQAPLASNATEILLDGFVVSLTPDGAVAYSTYLGGAVPGGSGGPTGIAVDASGSAFVIGFAQADFLTTPGAYLAAYSGGAPYLARLSPDGSTLIYGTYIDTQGDYVYSLAVDSLDNAIVLAAGGVLRFNPQGTAVTLSRVLPGLVPRGWRWMRPATSTLQHPQAPTIR